MRAYQDLKIAVAGTGYVGLSMATLLSQHHEVVAVGVIFYFIFVGINYKHSIMGGRFNEHFKNIHGED